MGTWKDTSLPSPRPEGKPLPRSHGRGHTSLWLQALLQKGTTTDHSVTAEPMEVHEAEGSADRNPRGRTDQPAISWLPSQTSAPPPLSGTGAIRRIRHVFLVRDLQSHQ